MPSFERESQRIVIAGASSLLGAELKSLLEESKFAGWDLLLVDEEVAAGTLTEAGGEPAVIQPVEEGAFSKARFVFFTGSIHFTLANFQQASESGAQIVHLSGHSAAFANSVEWFAGIETLRGHSRPANSPLAVIPSAGAEAIARLSLSLKGLGLSSLTATVFQPVSAAGKNGIDELESQTTQLLAFQSPGKQIFDAQVAFNMLDRFGPGSRFDLGQAQATLRNEIAACLQEQPVLPAVQLLHVPLFYGVTFSACAKFGISTDVDKITNACLRGGFAILEDAEAGPSNMSAAGETVIHLAKPEADPLQPHSWWFWGAADNIRLPAWNAVKLAEKLVP